VKCCDVPEQDKDFKKSKFLYISIIRKELTMQIARGVIAGILLFLGRELNFLFAAAMAALIGFRLTPLSASAVAWVE
jgi:hypothetical protein